MTPSNNIIPIKKKPRAILVSNSRKSDATQIEAIDSSFHADDLSEPLHNESQKGLSETEDQIMNEHVTRRELEAMKELMNANRVHDNQLNEARILRMNDKIENLNQSLSQKIDSSNTLLISQLNLVSKDIESMTSKLSLTFEKELETRFAQERQASAAEAKATRMWLWALAIPSIIGIIQIVQAYNN